jgi:hypothetical protein
MERHTDRDETIHVERTHRDREEYEAGRKGGVVSAAYPGAVPRTHAWATAPDAGEAVFLGVSRASWGAVWAGFFIGTMTYILLNVLGAALGITWMEQTAVAQGQIETAAGIWLIVTTLIAFFVGGFVTGRMSALPGHATGAMNGFLYGCFAIVLLAALAMVPAMANVPNITTLMGGFTAAEAQTQQQQLQMAQNVAWWSFAGLVVALVMATVGGLAGARYSDVDPLTTGEEQTTVRERA